MEEALRLYTAAIGAVLRQGHRVCILSHASVDIPLCKKLKASFKSDDRVILLEQDFNCLEFNELVKRFPFLIASRFHALVHAYKNAVPCIAIGWAVKYQNLLKTFEQERFAFDVGKELHEEELDSAIARLSVTWREKAERIRQHLQAIQENNVFDVLELDKEK